MSEEQLPLARGQGTIVARMTTNHERVSRRLHELLPSRQYSFRSGEVDGKTKYALLEEKDGKFRLVCFVPEKYVNAFEEWKLATYLIHKAYENRELRISCMKWCPVGLFFFFFGFLDFANLVDLIMNYTPFSRMFVHSGMMGASMSIVFVLGIWVVMRSFRNTDRKVYEISSALPEVLRTYADVSGQIMYYQRADRLEGRSK